jgi:hypothetical protein
MPLLRNLSVLLVKTEVTYNTDPTPTGAADAVLVGNLDVSWPTDVVDRIVVDNSLSRRAPIHGRKYAVLSFDVELKGSGAAGAAADFGPLLEACGYDETVDAGVSVTNELLSSSIGSVTIHAYFNGKLFKATGCRGNVSGNLPAGQPGILSFTMTGHAVSDADTSLPTPTFDSTVPVPVKNAAFTIDSFAAVISSLQFDLGNEVVIPDSVSAADGYGEVTIAGRNVTGSIDPEATLVSVHDFWSKWEDGTQMALSIALTGSAGNIVTITAPKVVYRELSLADRENILTYELPFSMARSTGDDELKFVFT